MAELRLIPNAEDPTDVESWRIAVRRTVQSIESGEPGPKGDTGDTGATGATGAAGIDKYSYTTVAVATTLSTDTDVYYCNGTFTVTLPTAVGNGGQFFIVKNIGTGTITIDGNGAETIDNELTQVLEQYNSVLLISDNAEWWVH